MWPRRQETVPRPDASPPRCAQLMGLASRGCLVLVLGATAERRKLLFRSDLGLPWIRILGVPPIQVKQTKLSWAGRSTGISPTITESCSRTRCGRIASIDTDIARHRRADRGASGPFHAEGDPGHQGPHRRGPGRSAGTTGARAPEVALFS